MFQNDIWYKGKSNTDESATIVCYNEFEVQGVVIVTSTKRSPKELVLDSGCSFHMYPIKGWFIEFNDQNGGQVQMGNDMTYKIKGIGKINLVLENSHVLELSLTRYVPDL